DVFDLVPISIWVHAHGFSIQLVDVLNREIGRLNALFANEFKLRTFVFDQETSPLGQFIEGRRIKRGRYMKMAPSDAHPANLLGILDRIDDLLFCLADIANDEKSIDRNSVLDCFLDHIVDLDELLALFYDLVDDVLVA